MWREAWISLLAATTATLATLQYGDIGVGETVRLNLTITAQTGSLSVGVCGYTCLTPCSVATTYGINGTTFGHEIVSWKKFAVIWSGSVQTISPYNGPRGFIQGESYVFVVKRTSESTALMWLEDHPNDVATLPIAWNQGKLQVRTQHMVQFLDEEQREKRQSGDTFAIGGQNRIRLTMFNSHSDLFIAMCNNDTCTVFRSRGMNDTAFGYMILKTSSSDFLGWSSSTETLSSKPGPEEEQLLGEDYVFEIQRHVAHEVVIFFKKSSAKVVVPIAKDQNRLFLNANSNVAEFLDPRGSQDSPGPTQSSNPSTTLTPKRSSTVADSTTFKVTSSTTLEVTSTTVPVTTSTSPRTTSSPGTFSCPRPFNPNVSPLYAHPASCTKFYACFSGVVYGIEMNCQSGRIFDRVSRTCDLPWRAVC